jgi:hypothetical protein
MNRPDNDGQNKRATNIGRPLENWKRLPSKLKITHRSELVNFSAPKNSTENVGLEPMGLSPAFGAWQAPPVPPLEAFSETRLL